MEDDEGTVVYFRTSPAVQGQEQQFTNDFSFTEHDNTGSESIKTDSPPSPEGSRGILRRLLTYCSDAVVNFLKITPPDLSCWENECCHDISMAIRDSPLLTEEDYQLLYFALLKPRPTRILHPAKPRGILSTYSKGAALALFISVLVVCVPATRGVLCLSLLLMGLLVLLVCVRAVIRRAVSTSCERGLRGARQSVTDYCREVETLVSLLSLCLRTVQEADMVNRQFTRPLATTGRNVGKGHHQSLGLHCCMFSVCQTVVEGLRNTTLSLSTQHPVNVELDSSGVNYLAHSSLSSLHTHLATQLDNISREETRNHKCFSYESLKDAANLLAVQNSELLRHTALSLLDTATGDGDFCRPVGTTTVTRSKRVLLEFLAVNLNRLREEMLKNRLRLEWAHIFLWNHLFGEPPARPVALENSGATESSMTVPLTAALSRDVHSMDVRTMAALQRIRELGNLLTEENKVEEPILKCKDQLGVIQRMIDSVSDQIEDTLGLLHHHPQRPCEGHSAGGGEDEERVEDSMREITAESDGRFQLTDECSSSSEDEKVFEGYVPAVEGETEGSGRREEGGVEEREREVSAKMVRELEGVLAVRSERREREREERRRRRQRRRQTENETEDPRDLSTSEDKAQIHEVLNCEKSVEKHTFSNSEETDIGTSRDGGKEPVDDDVTTSAPQNDSLPVSSENMESSSTATENNRQNKPQSDHLLLLPTEGGHQEAVGLPPGVLADRVAAIAALRRRGRPEETFGSDDDDDDTLQHSESD